MNTSRIRNNLLATTIFCGAALSFATPASAQLTEPDEQQPQAGPVEATPSPDESAEGDPAAAGEGDIIVTGSRIPQPNLTSVSPVTVVNSTEIRLQGTSRTEDMLNSLPQSFAAQGSNLANGATGTANANLRGLGPARTLVLVNGRRLMPGDPSNSQSAIAPDINFVPAQIIDRVDVLTGGASSVYGSDAVAGVVNFIMNTNFEGIRLDGQYSFYQHHNDSETGIRAAADRRGFPYPRGNVADGGTVDLAATIGAGFDDNRGHVVAYATYRKATAVMQGNRDYSACATNATATGTPFAVNCGGSATSPVGTFFTNVGTFQIGPNRTFIPGSTPYNFAPLNYFQRPDERYTAGAFANYEINDALRPYAEVMFMNDRSVAQIAPGGNFGNTLFLNCDNPLLSAQQRAIVCAPAVYNPADLTPGNAEEYLSSFGNLVGQQPIFGPDPDGEGPLLAPLIGFTNPTAFIDPTTGQPFNRGNAQILRRNVEGGPRRADLEHTDFRIVTGMRGDLSDVWSYDAYYQYGQVNYGLTYSNEFSQSRLLRALDVVEGPNGQPVCRSVLTGDDPNCVPYDIFALGGVSQAAINYLNISGLQRGHTRESVAEASLTGELGGWGVQSPWANEGVGIALGVQYRKESIDLDTDISFRTGDLTGQGAATLPINGAFDVREAFAETRIPLITESFIHNLSIEAGYRYSKYRVISTQNKFSTNTYKLGVDFSPIRDLRLRASYNRAVRAPNIQELFAAQNVQLNGSSDPCAGAAPEASLAACQAMGVTAAQYGKIQENPAGQYNGLVGGNPELLPEKATTKSVGVVLQPSFLPRFALTVDWFDIKLNRAISTIGQDTILAVCAQTQDPTFCGLVHRDQFGSLWRTPNGYVIDTNQNIGGLSTRGIDVSASYSMQLGTLGGLSFNFVGTWLDRLVTDPGVSDAFECVGLYGLRCGTPNPEWRHKARITFNAPNGVGLSAQWRYFKSVDVDRSSDQDTLAGPFAPFNATIPSQSYFDLALTAKVGTHYNFRLGVNNLLDRDPPIIGSGGGGTTNACYPVYCSGNTYPQVYDALGRYIFAAVTLDF